MNYFQPVSSRKRLLDGLIEATEAVEVIEVTEAIEASEVISVAQQLKFKIRVIPACQNINLCTGTPCITDTFLKKNLKFEIYFIFDTGCSSAYIYVLTSWYDSDFKLLDQQYSFSRS